MSADGVFIRAWETVGVRALQKNKYIILYYIIFFEIYYIRAQNNLNFSFFYNKTGQIVFFFIENFSSGKTRMLRTP